MPSAFSRTARVTLEIGRLTLWQKEARLRHLVVFAFHQPVGIEFGGVSVNIVHALGR